MTPDSSATTILFTDIEGSTELVEALGDRQWLEVLRWHNAVVREQVERYRGFEVKTVGDGFMVAFPSPEPAVGCAVAVQRALADDDRDRPPLRVRMGLHSGEALEEDGDFFGREVVMAARVAAQARGGEILVSEVVRAAAPDVQLTLPRVVKLKGLAGTHRLYPVAWRDAEAPAAPSPPAAPGLEERETARAQLAEALQAAADGRGSMVAVTGAAGLGKTTLLRLLEADALLSGLPVLTAHGSEIERPYAFGLVRQLVEPVLGRLPQLAGPAARALGLDQERDDELPTPYPAYAGLARAIATLGEESPFVLIVDDAHWADDASLAFLGFLARRLRTMPVLLVVAARDDEPEAPELVDPLLAVAPVRVAPAPLSPEAVARVVTADEPEAAPEFALACHRVSGGVPLYLRELLIAARTAGIPPDRRGARELAGIAGASLRRLVLNRLVPLGDAAVALARACAILDARADVRTAGRLAGLSAPQAVSVADALVQRGILRARGPLAFAHPMMRSVVEEEMPPGVRARLHAEAARLLREEEAPPQEVAAHLLATEPQDDPETIDTLRAAAAAALAAGSPANALAFLERALRELPPPETLLEVLAAAAHAALRASRPARSIELARRAAEQAATPEAHAHALVLLMNAMRAEFSRTGTSLEWDTDARPVLERAAAAAEALRPDQRELRFELEAVAMSAQLARLTIQSRPMPAQVTDRLRRLAAEATGRSPAERDLLAVQAGWAATTGSDSLESVLHICRLSLEDGALVRELGTGGVFDSAIEMLILCGAHAEAEQHLVDAAAHARRHGVVPAAALIAAYRASNAWAAGAPADALDHAADAAAHMAEAGSDSYVQAVAGGSACAALLMRGELAAAESTAHGLEHPRLRAHAAGLVAAARGEHHEAAEQLTVAQSTLDRRGMWRSGGPLRPVRPDLAVSLAAMGEHVKAREVVQAELAVARRFGQPSCIAEALRAQAVVEDDPEPLREAARVIRGSEARLVEAGVLLALGRTTRDVPALERALGLAERCGARAVVDAARVALASSDRSRV